MGVLMPQLGWKVLTHDWRPPVQGGEPLVFDGRFPVELPTVRVDTSSSRCAAGWNFTSDLGSAFSHGGLWPTGWPARAVLVEVPEGAIVVQREDKLRASTLRLIRHADLDEIRAGIRTISAEIFGPHAEIMAQEQYAWWEALWRPRRDPQAVEAGLRIALDARALAGWALRRYQGTHVPVTDQIAYAEWTRFSWEIRSMFGNLRAALFALDAWSSWEAADRNDSAWAAWSALAMRYAVLQGWQPSAADTLTLGLRDAYAAGLAWALPVEPRVLGWAMDDSSWDPVEGSNEPRRAISFIDETR